MSALTYQRGEKTLNTTSNELADSLSRLSAARYNDETEARRLTANLTRIAGDIDGEALEPFWKRTRLRDDLTATAATLRYVARNPAKDLDTAHAYLAAAQVTLDRTRETRRFLSAIGDGGPL